MRYLLPILTLLSITISVAQETRLNGQVKDQAGQVVPLVTIRLKEIDKGTQTNANGEFEFTALTENHYTLIASFVGYRTLEQKIKVEPGKITTLELQLLATDELLKEIVIKGYVNANERPVEAGKIAIRPMDLPQSIAVIDQKVLEQQQVRNLNDILINTNGVYIMGTTGGYQEEIAGRGFSFGNSNTFKNGIRFFNGMRMETSGLEKVEVMKGSSAILFGNVAAGGIINFITKKPKFDFGGSVSMQVGSFGLLKPTFDVYSGIGKSKKVAFRLNGSYETANSFREGVSSEKIYINPSLLFNLSKKSSLLLEADYLNDNITPDFGAGIINYRVVDIPRERFLGVKWSSYKANQTSVTATYNYRINDNWKITAIGAYRTYETTLFANTRPNAGTIIASDGKWIRNIQRSEVSDDYYLGQVDLKGNFNTGSIQHQVLIGSDIEYYQTVTNAFTNLSGYDTINIFGTKQYTTRTDIPTLTPSTITTAPVNRIGIYAQDLVHVTNYLKVLVGLRYSYQDTRSEIFTIKDKTTTYTANFDEAFSPRLGVVFQPSRNTSLFASYANSFIPNTGVIDTLKKALPPSLVDQFEAGIKNELWDGKISANLTVYQITNNNFVQSFIKDNVATNFRELAGAVRSKGVEVDIIARPVTGLSIIAGYSYNETRYIRSTSYIVGSQLRYNPNHTANLSANFAFSEKLNGLSIGLTGFYFGDRYAGRSKRVYLEEDAYDLVPLPAYTQLDATVSYTYKHFSLRAKIGNLTNALSYNVHDDNSVNPIIPRNYSATFVYKF